MQTLKVLVVGGVVGGLSLLFQNVFASQNTFAVSSANKTALIQELQRRESVKPIRVAENPYIKYLCNGKTQLLEIHEDQPGYPSDGVCNGNMVLRHVCASMDNKLAGTVCNSDNTNTETYTKYLCNGETNRLEKHTDQPGYQSSNICDNNMQPWNVCDALDPNLAGRICHGGEEGFDCSTITDIPVSECQALVDLYDSTNGKQWKDSTNWLTAPFACNWYGVTCSADHVVELRQDDNNLSGPLPASIGNLSELKIFFFPRNKLSGALPTTLGNLTHLLFLVLPNNQLSGPLPFTLGNLTNLYYVDVSWNQLSGPIPATIGNLANLTQLLLYRNQLSGPIPATMGNLTNLNYLGLQDNQLSGPIPTTLGALQRLNYLLVRNNQLCGYIPESFQNLTALASNGFKAQENKLMTVGYSPNLLAWFQSIQFSFGTQNSLECK